MTSSIRRTATYSVVRKLLLITRANQMNALVLGFVNYFTYKA